MVEQLPRKGANVGSRPTIPKKLAWGLNFNYALEVHKGERLTCNENGVSAILTWGSNLWRLKK